MKIPIPTLLLLFIWLPGFGFAEGYGQAPPVENTVYASDFRTFQGLAQNSPAGTRVCVDPTLPLGTVWNANYSIYPERGVTVDGSTAPEGFRLNIKGDPDIGAVTMFVLTKGDNAIRCLHITGENVIGNDGQVMQTAGVFARTGVNYLIQHLTIENVNDDAISVGHPGVTPVVKNVSILDNRMVNNAKNILISGQRPDQAGASKLSIGRNYMEGGGDRSPNNAGYQEVQLYNNVIINNNWGAFCQVTIAGSQSPTMLAESNIFIDNPNSNLQAWKTTNPSITADGYINTDDGQGAFGNSYTGIGPRDVDTPVPANVPMPPSAATKMPTAQVRAYVEANAGARCTTAPSAAEELEFEFDQAVGTPTLEHTPDLHFNSVWSPVPGAVVTPLANDRFKATLPPMPGSRQIFRLAMPTLPPDIIDTLPGAHRLPDPEAP